MTRGNGQGTAPAPLPGPTQPARSRFARAALAAFALLSFVVFLALGTWQAVRLQWKLDLIERVEQRIHAEASPPPAPAQWPRISAETHEYRRLRVSGTYFPEKTVRVQASTVRGSGYWLLTPMRTDSAGIIYINRGFIPIDATGRMPTATPAAAPGGTRTVTGLLRLSEPAGGFLRDNDPAAGRWYSRDVQAIAAAQGLSQVAPYFVDADAGLEADVPGAPVGGLTVVTFRNHHLVYALTWYALALMVAGASFWVWRQERRRRGAAA